MMETSKGVCGMKYMHFKASCSYAALANLLERMGVDTEDTTIALEMGLPWLHAKEGDTYISGPMLQSAEWFNLWLVPHGLYMREAKVQRDTLCTRLQKSEPLMLGIKTPYGKHAVVFVGYDGAYHFINPTHKDSTEQMMLVLVADALLERVDDSVMLASVVRRDPEQVDLNPYLKRSIQILRENVAAIERFSTVSHNADAYPPALNALFRPLLLDGISMLTLAGEETLAKRFTDLQSDLMTFMRGPSTGRLADTLSLTELKSAAEEYVQLIEKQIQS